MANLKGIIHALKKKIAKQDEAIDELGSELGDVADKLADAQNTLRALQNPDMLVNGAPMTLARLQVMENGTIHILPLPTASVDTCDKTISKAMTEANGKKDEAVAALAGDKK